MTAETVAQHKDCEQRSRQLGLWYQEWAAAQDAENPDLKQWPAEDAFAMEADDVFFKRANEIMGVSNATA